MAVTPARRRANGSNRQFIGSQSTVGSHLASGKLKIPSRARKMDASDRYSHRHGPPPEAAEEEAAAQERRQSSRSWRTRRPHMVSNV